MSAKSYYLLVEKNNFPSKYLLNKNFNDKKSLLILDFTDFSRIGDIICSWKQKNTIIDEIDATLSADALFFHLVISISDKIDIFGMEIL